MSGIFLRDFLPTKCVFMMILSIIWATECHEKDTRLPFWHCKHKQSLIEEHTIVGLATNCMVQNFKVLLRQPLRFSYSEIILKPRLEAYNSYIISLWLGRLLHIWQILSILRIYAV